MGKSDNMNKLDLAGMVTADFDMPFISDILLMVKDMLVKCQIGIVVNRPMIFYSERVYDIYRMLYQDGFTNSRRIISTKLHSPSTPTIIIAALYQLVVLAEMVESCFNYRGAKECLLLMMNPHVRSIMLKYSKEMQNLCVLPPEKPDYNKIDDLLKEVNAELNIGKSFEEKNQQRIEALEKERALLRENDAIKTDEIDRLNKEVSNLHSSLRAEEANSADLSKQLAAAKKNEEEYRKKYQEIVEKYADDKQMFPGDMGRRTRIFEISRMTQLYEKEQKAHEATKKKLAELEDKASKESLNELVEKTKLDVLRKFVDTAKKMHSWEEAKPIFDYLYKVYRGASEEVYDLIDEIDKHFNKKEEKATISATTNQGLMATNLYLQMSEEERKQLIEKK